MDNDCPSWESHVRGSFGITTDYCDRIQLVKVKEETNSEDIICKLEEAEDELKENEGNEDSRSDEMDPDDFFVYNFGNDQRPRQKARSRQMLYTKTVITAIIGMLEIDSLLQPAKRFIPLQYKKKYATILKSKGYNKFSFH